MPIYSVTLLKSIAALQMVQARLVDYDYIIILLTALSSVLAERANITTLRHVHVIWRHGDRNPTREIPSDTGNRAETWPEGLGELTTKGIRQQYELGKYLRQRYDDFLSRKYLASEIIVRSSSFNRAIMSALANMAGLFEPEGNQIWNKDIKWQPVPVQVVPKENDPMLYTSLPCPVAEKLWTDYQENDPEMRRNEMQYSRLLKYLGEKGGYNRTLKLYKDVSAVHDPIFREHEHKDTHQWPAWMNMTIFSELRQLFHITKRNLFPTLELQRFRGGLLLGDILARMQNISNDQQKKEKFYAYSAHDSTLIALLNNLGAPQAYNPPYAATLIFELHEVKDQYFVEVYYHNSTDRTTLAHVIEVGECHRPCSLQQFAIRSEQRIPKDWYKECGFDECTEANNKRSQGNRARKSSQQGLMIILFEIATLWLFPLLLNVERRI